MDELINQHIAPYALALNHLVFYKLRIVGTEIPLIVLWLLVAGIFFTLYFRFVSFTGLGTAFRLVKGKYRDTERPESGEISHFQALSTALSGTVGIGNIGGVAIAISLGGPGATFWMIVAGILGMSTKFVECTLGVKYREVYDDGSVSGGPMFYLLRGLADRGHPLLGKALGFFYAIVIMLCAYGIGNMFQANQVVSQLTLVTGGQDSWFAGQAWIPGLVIAFIVGAVIIGGIKSIGQVTSKLVPFMAIFYFIGSIAVLIDHADRIPMALQQIITGAFAPEGVAGGAIGVMVIGIQRALFSNEAGIGSASIAHSAVKTNNPVSEGYVALFEPFADTVVICTLTALVILTTIYTPELASSGLTGVQITSTAFSQTMSWAQYPLAFAIFLFGISTMISWSYYGLQGWIYLFGHSKLKDRIYMAIYLFCAVIGPSLSLKTVLLISDAMIFLASVPNILAMYYLVGVVKSEKQAFKQWRLTRGLD